MNLPRFPFVVAALVAISTGIGFAATQTLPNFTPDGTQPGLQHELEANSDCVGCHSAEQASDKPQIAWNTWAGTMKANAARDPLFWAALDVANNDVPGIGDFCLRCHSTSAWYGGRVHKTGTGTVDGSDGCKMLGNHANGSEDVKNDFGGIQCAACHRQTENAPIGATPRAHNGNLHLSDSDCDENSFGPCRFGPYSYGKNDSPPPHNFQFNTFVQRSEFCADCHEVTSPTINGTPFRTLIVPDGGGNPAGINTGVAFPIERTYREWLLSDFSKNVFNDGYEISGAGSEGKRFGQTCQSCHMRSSQEATARACNFTPLGSRTGNLPKHEFAGANVWMIDVLKGLYGGPSGLNRETEFDQSKAIAMEMLTQHSASLSVALDPLAAAPTTLTARVRVRNLSGHKLPTGYAEGRRMWLNVVARDASNQIIFESGAYNTSTGALTQDPQARVYEVKHGTWNASTGVCETTDNLARPQFHFVLNNCIAKDNRIPPRGFSGKNDLETQPVPLNYYPETAPGSGILVDHDDAVFSIPVTIGTSLPITVTAELKHQIATKEYIEFLRDQAVENAIPSETQMCLDDRPGGLPTGPQNQTRGQFMYDLWNNNGKSTPVVMEAASATSTAL